MNDHDCVLSAEKYCVHISDFGEEIANSSLTFLAIVRLSHVLAGFFKFVKQDFGVLTSRKLQLILEKLDWKFHNYINH